MKDKEIIIIGAGPAGLTAGLELVKKGYKVKILEKDPSYVGGISRTVRYKDYRFDIGGHRFFSKNQEIVDWWKDIMGEDFLTRPRISRWYYKGKFFNYPINVFEVLFKFGPIFALRIFFSYLYRKIKPVKPENNLDAWFRNNFGDYLAKPFFIDYNLKLWGIPCSELSMDFATQRIKGVSMLNTILESVRNVLGLNSNVKSFIQEFNYPKYGPGELWERVRDRFLELGGEIIMDCNVVSLKSSGNNIVSVTTEDGREIHGNIFLSTMPFKDLVLKLDGLDEKDILEAAKRLKFRDFITVSMVINKPFISEDTWVYTHDEKMKPIRFQNFNNWSPYMVPNKDITVIGLEYVCTKGDDLWSLSDIEMKEQAKNDFVKLGFAKEEEIIDSSVVRMEEVYPVYDFKYKENFKMVKDYIDRFDNLFPFGRGGIHHYNNTDHSMMTALLTVKNVISGKKIYDVLEVNNDAEYHEEK